MSDQTPAPIVLFVYKRLDHTIQTIEYLRRNMLASESDLIIFSDYGKAKEDEESVLAVREYIRSIIGFKRIEIIERDENFGLAKNIVEGVSEVIDRYGKVIVLEDDIITSKNFLCYMNKALDYYRSREDIFAITGFNYELNSLQEHKEDTYLAYRPSSWGWATWKEEWEEIDWDVSDFNTFINDKKAVQKFNRGGIDLTRMLRHSLEGKNHSWAIRWFYAMDKQDKYAVYPKVPKIENIGFGVDATHCSNENIHRSDMDETSQCDFDFTDEKRPDEKISKEFQYQSSYRNKIIKKSSVWINRLIKSTSNDPTPNQMPRIDQVE